MADFLPEIDKAGGGSLNAVREQFGIIFRSYTGQEFVFSSREARTFAIEILLLCEQADAAWAHKRWLEQTELKAEASNG